MLGNIPRTTAKQETALLRILPEIAIDTLIDVVNQAYETSAIAYWVESAGGAKRKEIDGSELVFEFQIEEPEKGAHTVNVNTIKDGIERIINRKVSINTDLYAQIYFGISSGEFDIDACDAIVQAGLFGELIYG